MGYQDGTGLRPGRSVNRLQSDVGASNYLGTSRAMGGNYRAAGAISPVRPSQDVQPAPVAQAAPVAPAPTSTVSPQGSALFQYTAPDYGLSSAQMPSMPKTPGIMQQVALGVGGKVAGDLAVRGIDAALGSFSAPSASSGYGLSSSPSSFGLKSAGLDLAPSVSSSFGSGLSSASSLPSYDLGANYSLSSASDYVPSSVAGIAGVDAGAWAAPAISDTALFEGGSAAADMGGAASGASSFGTYAPYAGAAVKALQGDIGGAAKSAGAVAIGTALGGPIGGAIGAVVGGGSVICTEMERCKEVSAYQLSLEMHYARTVNPTVLRGYRYWAVPVVRKMRKSPFVYRIARAVALRFMQESRARLGYGDQTLLGIVAIPICYSICWIIGKFVNDVDYQSLFVKEQK